MNKNTLTVAEGTTFLDDVRYYITDVVIPSSVTEIGYKAFQYCSNLKSVVIPSRVTSIDDYAFDGCLSLESINIPDRVASIGDYAFYSCSSLKEVAIPDSVTSIGEFAYDKKDYEKKLLSIYEPLVNHLEKIYYFRDYHESVSHWKKEVYNFLHSSSLLKNNKLPPKKLFMKHLWEDNKEVFEEHHKNNVKDLNYDYGKKFCEVEVDFNFARFYKDYVDWISDYLSKKSVVSRDEVFEKIDGLLEEYSR